MILNTQIWTATIEAAKTAAANSPAWLRAIDRAAKEIAHASYWSYSNGVLTLISTTSHKTYQIDDNHTCEARGGICKHRAARRLMARYVERLAVTEAAPAAKPAKVERTVERDRFGRKVNVTRCGGWLV